MKYSKKAKGGILFWEQFKFDDKTLSLNLYFQFDGEPQCSNYARYIIKDNSYSPFFGRVANMSFEQLYALY